jgi:hypothetical protein
MPTSVQANAISPGEGRDIGHEPSGTMRPPFLGRVPNRLHDRAVCNDSAGGRPAGRP